MFVLHQKVDLRYIYLMSYLKLPVTLRLLETFVSFWCCDPNSEWIVEFIGGNNICTMCAFICAIACVARIIVDLFKQHFETRT